MDPLQIQKYKKWSFIFLVGVLVFYAFYWVFTHGFIEVHVQNTRPNSEISYFITGTKTVEKTTSDTTLKRIIKRGDQEVMVTQGGLGFVASVRTRGFLSSTKINAELLPQRSREFVGDNPFACMQYVENILLSMPCGSSLSLMQTHIPATEKRAGYAQKTRSPITGIVEGMITLRGVSYALIKAPAQNEDQGAPHTIYRLTSMGDVADGIALNHLSPDLFYELVPYKEGFVVFDSFLQDINYYSAPDSQPSRLKIDHPENKELQPQFLRAAGGKLALVFSNSTSGDIHSLDEESGGDVETKLILVEGDNYRAYDFDIYFTDAFMCAEQLLCVQSGAQLFVYDLSDKRARLVYKLGNTQSIHSFGDSILIVRDKYVLRFDPSRRRGVIDYDFGDYNYCGLGAISDTAYTICVINSQNKRHALKISVGSVNSDDIDKKLHRLIEAPFIDSVSAHGKIIYISPKVGNLVPDPVTGEFGYDPKRVQEASRDIAQKLDELGIDQNKYKVINTLGVAFNSIPQNP